MLSKALGIGLGISLIVIAFLWHNNGQLREDLGSYKQSLDQATLTNENNAKEFDKVNADLTECVEQFEIDKAENEITVANLEARYARLEIQHRDALDRRDVIFRDPKCAELRDLDMAAICPDWASELRQRAATLGGNKDRGEEGSGSGAAAGEML